MDERTYQISVSWLDDILHIVLTGQATELNIAEIVREVTRIATEMKPRLLLMDARGIKGRLGLPGTFLQAQEYPKAYVTPAVAVLDVVENRKYYTFHETAARNVGFNLRYFNESEEAVAWLRSQADHPE